MIKTQRRDQIGIFCKGNNPDALIGCETQKVQSLLFGKSQTVRINILSQHRI